MKLVDDYIAEYGNISKDPTERILNFIQTYNIKKFKKPILGEIQKINSVPWKRIDFVIYILPKATPRPRSTSRGSFFYVKGAKDNKKFFEKQVEKMEDLPYIITPCIFRCVSYFPIPKSMKPMEQILAEFGFIRPMSKPDFDNLAKTYSDMIQEVILHDDAYIVEGTSQKYYSWKPRIEIHIEYMEDFDSDFNRNKILKKGRK